MSGHEPRQDPEERRYAPRQGSANAMPQGTQPESGDKGKSNRESRFDSFREWINTSVGVTTVIIAVLAFIGGGTAITVKLASPNPGPTVKSTPTPPISTSPGPSNQNSNSQNSSSRLTNAQFCAPGHNTCLTSPYPANLRFYINPNPYTSDTFTVTGDWASATSAAAGTYAMNGNYQPAEPVSDITLGAPVVSDQSTGSAQYTCLSFKVNATSVTVYAHEAVNTDGWTVVSYNCMQ
jgi:hypothetical protein